MWKWGHTALPGLWVVFNKYLLNEFMSLYASTASLISLLYQLTCIHHSLGSSQWGKYGLFCWMAQSHFIVTTLGGKCILNLMLQITYTYDEETKTLSYLSNSHKTRRRIRMVAESQVTVFSVNICRIDLNCQDKTGSFLLFLANKTCCVRTS